MTTDTKPAAAPAVVVVDPTPEPSTKTVAVAIDPYTQEKVEVFVGAQSHDDDEFVADPKSRGDFVEAPPETLVVLDPNAKKKADEDAAEAQKIADEQAAKKAEADEAAAKAAKTIEDDQARDPKTGQFIPKSRFDEVNSRRKEAERKLADRERADAAAKQATENAYDFDAAETRYMEAVLDGRQTEAAGIRKEIRAAEQSQYEAVAATVAQRAHETNTLKERMDVVIDTTFVDYPMLDVASGDAYRADIVGEIDAMHAGFIQAGMDPADALQKAITNAAKVYGLDKAGEAPIAPEVTPEVKPAGKKPEPRSTVADKVAAAEGQPAPTSAAGVGSSTAGQGTVKVGELTDEQFDALPESTKARLRGDFRAA